LLGNRSLQYPMVAEEGDQLFGATVVNLEVKVGTYHAVTGPSDNTPLERKAPTVGTRHWAVSLVPVRWSLTIAS